MIIDKNGNIVLPDSYCLIETKNGGKQLYCHIVKRFKEEWVGIGKNKRIMVIDNIDPKQIEMIEQNMLESPINVNSKKFREIWGRAEKMMNKSNEPSFEWIEIVRPMLAKELNITEILAEDLFYEEFFNTHVM